MTAIPVDIKLIQENAQIPSKNNAGDLCYDFYCVADDSFDKAIIDGNARKRLILDPGDSHLFHTGVALKIPEGWGLQLWDRSGMGGKRQIHRLAGIIDSSYTGEILVSLINLSKEYQAIYEGDRIIQGCFIQQIDAEWNRVKDLEKTNRGASGFGSSGA